MLEAERQAYFAQFGVFDQDLVAKLTTMNTGDHLDVALWMLEPADLPQLVTELNRSMGSSYNFIQSQSLPLISATMTKADLLKIQFHPAIDRIYVNQRLTSPEIQLDGEFTPNRPTVLSALPTEYIPPLWAQGYKG